ncbi:MAG: Ig-like domain-containing protein [Desulfuromonadaceae bacterium]|nr:Ig-like domain-containing protein [Desulfuromonadaceae bacterium]
MKRLGYLLLLLLVLIFAGCGGGGSDSGGTATDLSPGGGAGGGGDPTAVTVDSIVIKDFFNGKLIATGADPGGTRSSGLIRATVKDTAGELLANQTITFNATAGGFTPSATVTTGDDGVAQVFYVAPATLAEPTISAVGGGVLSNILSVNITNGPAATLKLSSSSLSLGPGGSATLSVLAQDALGFPVPAEFVVFEFVTEGSGKSVLGKISGTTDSSGSTSVAYEAGSLPALTTTVTDQLRARAGTVISNTLDITITEAATFLRSFALQSARKVQQVDDGFIPNAITAVLKDSSNAAPTTPIPVTFITSLGILKDAAGNTGQQLTINSDTNTGFATLNLLTETVTGQAQVVAFAGGFSDDEEISFVAGPVFKVTPVATPNRVAAAGSSILQAYAEDKYGNRSAKTTLNFFLDDNDVGGSLDSYELVTDDNGRVTTTYRAGNIPGVYNTVVIAPNAVSASKLITVDANLSVGSLTLDAPSPVVGGTYNSTTVTATALDAAGLPLSGVNLAVVTTDTGTVSNSITLYKGDTASGSIYNSLTDVTDSNGQVVLTVKDTEAENVTLSVSAGGKVVATQLYFGATLSIIPNSITATGSTTLTALLKDATNKPLSGQEISFAVYNSATPATDTTISVINTQTLPDGTAKVEVVDTAADGGTAKLEATVGRLTATPATVNFQADYSGLTLTATPTSRVATNTAGSNAITINVKATDAAGLPFEGVAVTYNSTGSPTLTPASATTGTTGATSFTVTNDTAENVVVTVASGTTSVDVPLYFGARLTLTPSTALGVADGVTPVELTATVKDAGNAVIDGVDVYFKVTAGYNSTLSVPNAATDVAGQAKVKVIDRVLETTTIEAQAGQLPAVTSNVNFAPSDPRSMTLETTSTALSLGGVATITATVTDILGNNVADGTQVTFSSSTVGTITSYNSTTAGKATVQFNAGTTAGQTVITATAGTVSKAVNISVLPAAAGVVTVESITPETIHILGTTGVQNATITFRVTDGSGNNVAEGTPISFALDSSAVGGETLYNSASGTFGGSAQATTTNGLASVTLRSGIIAGPVDVIASVTGTGASSLARVIVVGALPDSMHMDMSSSWLNLSSYVINNLEAEVMVNIGDRFGNVPIDGTPVSFYVEPGCGTIGTSAGFTASTESGVARATFRGIITPDDNTLRGHTYNSAIAQKGLCTLLATTTGAEFFYDNNGDGIYNAGDTCSGDQGEPYVDANDNGSYDPDEFYVDINNNGSYDVADGICQANTTVWTEGKILLSSWFSGFNPSATVGNFASTGLAVGEGQTFTFDFEDLQGNSLVAGSSFTVEADGGKLYGNVSKDQGDTTATGGPYSVTLYSDSEADAKPKLVEIKWTYTEAGNADSPGSNPASLEYSLVGWINIATSAYPIDSVEVSTGAETLIANGTNKTLLRATVTDSSGAAVYNSVVDFAVSNGTVKDASGPWASTGQATTDTFGNATITYNSSTTPGTVDFSASIGGVSGTGSFKLVTGPAASISVDAAPKTLLPGAETTVSAIVRDATLNPIKDATVFFSIQTNNSDGAFNVTGAKTDEFGVATATYTAGTTLFAASVTDTLQAASGGLVPVTVDVTVSTAGSQIDTVELSAGASSLRADGASTTSIYATVKDANGNPVPFVDVSFASQTSEFKSLITASRLTDAAGVATVTYTAGDTTGTDTVTATVGGVSAQLDITLVPGAATGLTLTPSDAGPVDPRATVTYTAAVKDANNNPVPNQVVLFSITTNNSSAALSAASATTDANGLATVIYTAGTKTDAGTADDTVTATLGALNTNHTLTVTNGNTVVNEVGVTAASATIVSDNTTSTAVRALLLDTNGYTVPSGISVTFSTSVGQISADNATWGTAAVPVTTNVAGIATVYIKGPNPIALGTTVVSATATVDGVAGSTTVDFVAGSPDSVTLGLSATSVIPGESVTLTATVQDSNSLVIKDETVTFIYNTIKSTGTLTSTTAVTDSSGLATVTFVAGSAAGTDGFKASAAAVTSSETTLTVDPTLTPIGGLTLTAANDAITADGVTETLLRANVVDRNGTAIQDVDVAFSTNIGGLYNSATTSYNSAIAAVTTNSTGDAEILLRSETSPGIALVTASIGGFNAQTTVTFVPGGPVLANSYITASPSTIPADGISTSEITVFLADTNGNPVSDDTEVTLIYTRGTLISENPAKTISGRAVFTLQAPSTPGAAITLSIVELSGKTGTLNVGAAAGSGSPEPANMLLSVGKSNISVAGVGKSDSTTLTIEIFKDNGAYINEDDFDLDTLRVQFVTNPGGGEYISGVNYNSVVQTLDDSVTSIDVVSTDGIATLNFFAGNLPGVIEVLVTALDTAGNPTTIVAALPQLTISSGPPHTIVLTQESNSITNLGGGVYRRSGTAIVTDRYGNSVPDDTALSLGLVDSLIAYYNLTGVVTITNSAILADTSGVDFTTASIIRNGLRKIQNNDRVLLLNAPTEDRSRFVDSVESATTLRVRKDYQNDSPGGNYHYLVGSSLLGGFISGEDADANIVTGQATTKDGLARFYVTYPVTNIFVGCQGYSGDGPESYPTTDTRFDDPQSAQVYVVAAASDNSAATINRGEFCYAGVRPVTITVAPKTLSGDDSVDIQVEDANGVRLPFVPLKSSVVVTNREETFACTNASFTDEATCTAAGTCSDGTSTRKAACEAVPADWTAEMWQSTGFSDFGVTVNINSTALATDDFTDAGGLATADITVTGANTQSGDAATITIYSPALNASEVIDITLP